MIAGPTAASASVAAAGAAVVVVHAGAALRASMRRADSPPEATADRGRNGSDAPAESCSSSTSSKLRQERTGQLVVPCAQRPGAPMPLPSTLHAPFKPQGTNHVNNTRALAPARSLHPVRAAAWLPGKPSELRRNL